MKHSKLEQLIENVIDWGAQKGIYSQSNPMAQLEKTKEELVELAEAVVYQAKGKETYINSKGAECHTESEIIDSIGDILVTLIMQCQLQGITLQHCLEQAYNVISKRNGKMIDGKFVKDV